MKNKTGLSMFLGAVAAILIVIVVTQTMHRNAEFCIYRNYDGVKMCGDAARQFCAAYGCG